MLFHRHTSACIKNVHILTSRGDTGGKQQSTGDFEQLLCAGMELGTELGVWEEGEYVSCVLAWLVLLRNGNFLSTGLDTGEKEEPERVPGLPSDKGRGGKGYIQ